VYVKLHNGGATPASGNLKVYYANASSSLTWPGGFTLIGDIPVSGFAAGATKVVEATWADPPGTGHYCMIARWESASDPMTTAEGPDINVNTRSNNNIVWRNMDIVGLGGDTFVTTFQARAVGKRGFWLRFTSPGDKPYFPDGYLKFLVATEDRVLKGQPEGGIEALGSEYIVKQDGGQIYFELGRQTATVRLEFRRTPELEGRHYRVEIDQTELGKEGRRIQIGGMVYEVDASLDASKQ
jgi:hypothetical protein